MDASAAIDRKLHRIVLSSNKNKYPTGAALARAIADRDHVEFSYVRGGKLNHCDWVTIRGYISFAQEIGLLGPSYAATASKASLQSLSGFRGWCGNLLLTFTQAKGFGVSSLESAVIALVKQNHMLPTTRHLYDALKVTEVSEQEFRWALTLQSILRPATLGLCRRWLWIPSKTFDY
jgi:hypothetical protein